MAKRKITVVKAFTLTHDDRSTQVFEIGEHSVNPKVAEHWYVKAHTDGGGENEADEDLKAENEEKAEDEASQGKAVSAKSTG